MEFKSLDNETAISFTCNMFKHKELIEYIYQAFKVGGVNRLLEIMRESRRGNIPLNQENRSNWFEDGIECEILKPNSMGWQKGKIRINITIQFCPNDQEEESILNEIRQNQLTQ